VPKPSSPPGPGPRAPAQPVGGQSERVDARPHRHPPGEISNALKRPQDRRAPQPVSTGFLCQPCVSTLGGHVDAPCPRPAAAPPRPIVPRPQGGSTFVSQKNHHIAAFVTNILGSPAPRAIARDPRRGPTFVSQKNQHIAAFVTNILGSPAPRPIVPGPRRGPTFVSQKNHHIAAFETNIPRSHRPRPAEGSDLCFSEKPHGRSLRNKHPSFVSPSSPAFVWRAFAPSPGASAALGTIRSRDRAVALSFDAVGGRLSPTGDGRHPAPDPEARECGRFLQSRGNGHGFRIGNSTEEGPNANTAWSDRIRRPSRLAFSTIRHYNQPVQDALRWGNHPGHGPGRPARSDAA
jgi:hypothetical protein